MRHGPRIGPLSGSCGRRTRIPPQPLRASTSPSWPWALAAVRHALGRAAPSLPPLSPSTATVAGCIPRTRRARPWAPLPPPDLDRAVHRANHLCTTADFAGCEARAAGYFGTAASRAVLGVLARLAPNDIAGAWQIIRSAVDTLLGTPSEDAVQDQERRQQDRALGRMVAVARGTLEHLPLRSVESQTIRALFAIGGKRWYLETLLGQPAPPPAGSDKDGMSDSEFDSDLGDGDWEPGASSSETDSDSDASSSGSEGGQDSESDPSDGEEAVPGPPSDSGSHSDVDPACDSNPQWLLKSSKDTMYRAGRAGAMRMAGGYGVAPRPRGRRSKSPAALEHFLNFALQKDVTAPQAYGHKDVAVDGETHTLQPRLRTEPITVLFERYQVTVADKPKRERLGARAFHSIMSQLFPGAMRVRTPGTTPCPMWGCPSASCCAFMYVDLDACSTLQSYCTRAARVGLSCH